MRSSSSRGRGHSGCAQCDRAQCTIDRLLTDRHLRAGESGARGAHRLAPELKHTSAALDERPSSHCVQPPTLSQMRCELGWAVERDCDGVGDDPPDRPFRVITVPRSTLAASTTASAISSTVASSNASLLATWR